MKKKKKKKKKVIINNYAIFSSNGDLIYEHMRSDFPQENNTKISMIDKLKNWIRVF